METKTLGSHTITYYDDLEELPVDRLTPFMKFLTHLGSEEQSLDAMNKRIGQIAAYVARGDAEQAQELLRAHYQHLLDLQNIQPPLDSLAFACMVAEVDGKPCADLSEMGLTVVSERIKSLLPKANGDAV